MASGYRNSAGVDTDDLYDPDVVGDGPVATGYRRSDGSTLRYAAAKYGTPGAAIGYRLADGSDIGPLWSRKGTASYNLPIHGKTYTATQSGLNGSAQLAFNMDSNGTYSIVRSIRGVLTTLDSGTWLPAGDSASQYTCCFQFTPVTQNVAGNGSYSNPTNAPAPTLVALTTSRYGQVLSAVYSDPGTTVNNVMDVSCSYYRLGVLVHTVTVHFTTRSTI